MLFDDAGMVSWNIARLIMSTISEDLGCRHPVEGAAPTFEILRGDPELSAVHQAIQPDLQRPPDKTLAFFSEMPLLYGGERGRDPTTVRCTPR